MKIVRLICPHCGLQFYFKTYLERDIPNALTVEKEL